MSKKYASTLEVLEVLRKEFAAPEMDELFDKRLIGAKAVRPAVLKEAIGLYGQLLDKAKADHLSARLGSNTLTISWRAAWAGGPLVPTVRARLDRYISLLDISPPEKAGNGRRYSEHSVRVEQLPDRIIIYTNKLATDPDDSTDVDNDE